MTTPPCFELLRHRRQRGLSQGELARLAGVASKTIYRLERGYPGAPSVHTLVAVASALSLPPAVVFPEVLDSSAA